MDLALVAALAVGLAEHEREALAERDVARGVLVEQRVVEDRPEPADPPLAVDERALAEPGGAVVGLQDRRERVAALGRPDVDGPAALEADDEVAHHGPVR